MSTATFDALEDFAGPGGWDEGAKMLGLRFYGVDYDKAACETARAARHHREQADVTEHKSPEWARGKGHVSSPSCTLFSMAGSGVGRLVLDVLADGIRRILRGDDPSTVRTETQATIYPTALAEVEKANDKRKPEKRWPAEKVEAKARLDAKIASLVLEPARRIMELDPEWVALEQVPEVFPLWQIYDYELTAKGWSCFTVIINAADFGVPQTRKRAIFGASRVRKIAPPEPTHAEHPQDADLFGNTLSKWVCMADALGWGWQDEPSCTVSSGGAATGGAEPFANAEYRQRLREYVLRNNNTANAAERTLDEPAPTLYFGQRSNYCAWERRPSAMGDVRQTNGSVRPVDEPSPTITASMDNGNFQWIFERPATTVVGSFKPEVIAAPGYRTQESRQNAPGSVSVSVSVSEAGVLQSFRPDYPWQGGKSKQYEQVGNAIPPLMAAHVLSAVTGAAFVGEVAA